MTLEDYVLECHRLGFAGLCKIRFGFTEEELKQEHKQWMEYIMQHIPDPYPGIGTIIRRQKEEGGLICVVSHSHVDNILRDYKAHFDLIPDAIYGWELEPHQRKPNPWPLQDIMEKFGLKPEEILVVDDMKLACQMAEPLGVDVCYAGWSGMGIEEVTREMESICTYSFDSLEEFGKFLFA